MSMLVKCGPMMTRHNNFNTFYRLEEEKLKEKKTFLY